MRIAILTIAVAMAMGAAHGEPAKLCKFEYTDEVRVKAVEPAIQKLREPPSYYDTAHPAGIYQGENDIGKHPEQQKPGKNVTIHIRQAANMRGDVDIYIEIDPCTLEAKGAELYAKENPAFISCPSDAEPGAFCVGPNVTWP